MLLAWACASEYEKEDFFSVLLRVTDNIEADTAVTPIRASAVDQPVKV